MRWISETGCLAAVVLIGGVVGCGDQVSTAASPNCSASTCEVCAEGCIPVDVCIDGQWQCGCECQDCAVSPCPSCGPECQSADDCENSVWECACECPPTIGDEVSPITKIAVDINLYDGFDDPSVSDLYEVDVVTRQVTYNLATTVVAPDAPIQALVQLVASLRYRAQSGGMGEAIDGGAWPPTIAASNATSMFTVSVSDLDFAETDHSATGDVVSCDDYSRVTDALLVMVPGGGPYSCMGYW